MNKTAIVLLLGIFMANTYAWATASSPQSTNLATPTSSPQTASEVQNASETQIANASSSQATSAPANPHDPNAPTLAELQTPDDNELSLANKELLAKNAELESRVAELTTQVNVLVNERHGQFFLYGTFSTLLSFALGMVCALFFLKKKKSTW